MYRRIKDFLVYTFTEEHDSYNYVYERETYRTIRWRRVLFALSGLWLVGTCIYLACWAFAHYSLVEVMKFVGFFITVIAITIVIAGIVDGGY